MAKKGETKARYWTAVLYPENMREDWETLIGDLIGVPYAYCRHNKDTDTQSEHRKDHVHLIMAFPNTTTENHAWRIANKLSADGRTSCPGVQSVSNIRHMYEYLIHNTETCKKQGKHLYLPSERITGNNFDIGSYEQLSTAEKYKMSKELCDFICEHNITNFADFYLYAVNNFGSEYFELIQVNSGFYNRLINGNWQKMVQEK